ncbi:outer membrane beta-barrel family protein [Hymenobacter canadensis]|uniref:Outer membrane beta-barrel family protein n=1 Tax=Hymenobacter canadensis TaxID=2999067 RepID=A0ABY7LZ97_9BACT|nr:outer membrane beta-barrel family protein [Hymenobacter canadensis]WBA44273.1 outer membrane beta-barrel family protein [Hymenobacter canadensis]
MKNKLKQRKELLMLIFFIVASVNSFGQNYNPIIKGNVTDEVYKPLEYANVIIYQDSIEKQVIYTSANGGYEFKGELNKNYKIKILYLGYDPMQFNITLSKDTIIKSQFTKAVTALREVVIKGRKQLVERKIDRLIYNVENSINSNGSDALELLQKTPSLRVRNGEVGIIGKSKAAVMINDKLVYLSGDDLTAFLKSIKSDDISSIEVIPTPPAQYEAQGNSGLINIKTKNPLKDSYSVVIGASNTQATYSRLGGNIGVNFQKNKVTIASSINVGEGSFRITDQQNIELYDQYYSKNGNSTVFNKNMSARLFIDYKINKKSTIGIQYLASKSSPEISENSRISYRNKGESADSTINTIANRVRKTGYNTVNLHYNVLIDSLGKQLKLNFDVLDNADNNSRYFSNRLVNGNNEESNYLNSGSEKIKVISAKVDFILPVKFADLSFGSKLSSVSSESDLLFYNQIDNQYIIDNSLRNIFKYDENVQAFYASASKKINNLEIQLGLRNELTQAIGKSEISGEVNKYTYNKIFPTAYVTYKVGKANELAFSYGKRINRPAYWALSPFKWFNTPQIYSVGNPFLRPSITNNLEINHIYNKNINTSLFFSRENNAFEQLTYTPQDSKDIITTPLNFLTKYSYGIAESFTNNQLKWVEINAQAKLYYNSVESYIPNTRKSLSGLSGYLSIDNSIVINEEKGLIAEMGVWYQFPELSGIDVTTSYYSLNAGFKFNAFNKKIQTTISANDILKTDRPQYLSTVNGLPQYYSSYKDQRSVRVNLAYKFGNSKIRSSANSNANREEIRRVVH